MAHRSTHLIPAVCDSLVLDRSTHRTFRGYMGAFDPGVRCTRDKEAGMTGDVSLQLTIFGVGFIVFTIAMVGGLLTMKQWKDRDDQRATGVANLAPIPVEAETQGWR